MKIGIERLLHDLSEMGFEEVGTRTKDGMGYAIISKFIIPAGKYVGRFIELAIPAPVNYPQSVGASMHVKADPILYPIGNVPNVRNVIKSPLGDDWQYWSYQFHVRPNNSTQELISQINEIFRKN